MPKQVIGTCGNSEGASKLPPDAESVHEVTTMTTSFGRGASPCRYCRIGSSSAPRFNAVVLPPNGVSHWWTAARQHNANSEVPELNGIDAYSRPGECKKLLERVMLVGNGKTVFPRGKSYRSTPTSASHLRRSY